MNVNALKGINKVEEKVFDLVSSRYGRKFVKLHGPESEFPIPEDKLRLISNWQVGYKYGQVEAYYNVAKIAVPLAIGVVVIKKISRKKNTPYSEHK